MSYGVDHIDLRRLAANYVDRILRGANPADLPVQVPMKYETVVNLKTARALGLDVPSSLLVRADEVIDGRALRPDLILLRCMSQSSAIWVSSDG